MPIVTVTLQDGSFVGRGECQPNSRYHEDPGEVADTLRTFLSSTPVPGFTDVPGLSSVAARNALDCALWDLAAKRSGQRIWDILGRQQPGSIPTLFTLSLGSPDAMAAAARRAWDEKKTRLKLKLGGVGDDHRVAAVRAAVPEADLIVDANEAWDMAMLRQYLPLMAAHRISLIEQPLPAGEDRGLETIERLVPICADESCHVAQDVQALKGRYDAVNIKLDKTGGLSGALRLEKAAREAGLQVMVGCMLGTSLAMAPAAVIAANADFVDLDGPLLLSHDRDHKIDYGPDYCLASYSAEVWG